MKTKGLSIVQECQVDILVHGALNYSWSLLFKDGESSHMKMTPQGKAKKTRKFAEVKRMISPKDERL